jgi:hypothetical protein
MSRYKLLVAGSLMLGTGAFLIFSNPQALPLWFVWLAGPFLWYVGIAVTIVGIAVGLFLPVSAKEKQVLAAKQEREPIRVLSMQKFVRQTAPAGLIREIPAMGGFLL